MDEKHTTDGTGEWPASLAALRALSTEINTGLLALSKNDLQQFEASVAAQQRICDELRSSGIFDVTKLRALAAEIRKAVSIAATQPSAAEISAAQLFTVRKDLVHLNRVYAALVVRSQHLGQALLSLYNGARQGYSRDGKTVAEGHTWSCEV